LGGPDVLRIVALYERGQIVGNIVLLSEA